MEVTSKTAHRAAARRRAYSQVKFRQERRSIIDMVEKKQFIVFEFHGAKSFGCCHYSAICADDLAHMKWGEPTDIIVKRKAPYMSTRPVTHTKANREGQFYSIVECERFERLCREVDTEWDTEQAQLRTEIRRVVPSNRPCADEDVPDDLRGFIRVTGSGCWVWQGRISPQGYGLFRVKRKNVFAHRMVFERLVGPIPKGAMLLHSCDTPRCVCPAHLMPGTAKQNSDEMWSRGRSRRQAAWRIAEQWIAEKFSARPICEPDSLPKLLRTNIQVGEAGCWLWIGPQSQFGITKITAGGIYFEVKRYIVMKLLVV